MKWLLVFISNISVLFSYSQDTLINNFKIGNYVEVFKDDSLKFYFNCSGAIVEKRCASFYRIGKIDSININVTGGFNDFYMNGHIALTGVMRDNNLEDSATYYYQNGQVEEKGNYSKNMRTGMWHYYYANGQVKKIINYINGEPFILDSFLPNGKAQVVNGNGEYTTEFNSYKQCDYYLAQGNILNGKMDGEWFFTNANSDVRISTEYFNSGNFINGKSFSEEYSDKPRINLNKFYPNENIVLLRNLYGCPGDRGIESLRYKDSSLYSVFYPELLQNISNYDSSLENQWLIVGLEVNKNGKVENVNVFSSINDKKIEKFVKDILLKMNQWNSAIISSHKTGGQLFFTILFYNNQVVIPDFYYNKTRGY